jgi:large subunit ribosomal protein L3
MKIYGKKLKMTQLYRGNAAIGATPIIVENEDEVAKMSDGDILHIRGITKGKGFQGTVKRHGFAGGPKTHGQKNRHRAPGSIGNTALQRVAPGRRMAGRMGGKNRTVKNMQVVRVDGGGKTIFVRGAVPGNEGARVEIRKR